MSEAIQNDSLKEIDAIIKRFENPDEIREFEKGKFELLHLPGMVVGKATINLDGNGPWMFLHYQKQSFAM